MRLINATSLMMILLFSMTLCATADEREYSSVDEFVKSLSVDSSITLESIAEGDLNQDGLADRAILVTVKTKEINQPRPKLFILLQTSAGRYRVAQESGLGVSSLYKTSISMEIKRDSLYISLEAWNSLWAEHQFKFYKGRWRLIGFSQHSIVFDPNVEGHGKGEGVDADLNLLTGDIVFKTRTFNLDKGSDRLRKDKASGGQCMLADYDFEYSFCVDKWKTKKGERVRELMEPHSR